MKNYVVLQTGENQDLFPVTTSEGVFVDNGTKKLTNKLEEINQSITNIQDEVSMREGNLEVTIKATDLTLVDETYQTEIMHNLNSENLHISAKKLDTKEGYLIGWKIVDKNKILIKSDEQIGLSVILSANFFHSTQTISDNIAEEVVQARLNGMSLRDAILKRICYEDFNGNTIN